ncbi:hypothetical protein ACHAXA_002455 [Cyclostephanos tholiformis]|uniref:Uncharacterized protein n=1 Tax=Cyclostephanos tholiformis TaxID=382380 RepID=A0ABD3RG96_9STRA
MTKQLSGFPSTLSIVEHNHVTVVGSKQNQPEKKDQAYYIELAIAKRKLKEAELRAKNDVDLEYQLKLAEKKEKKAQVESRADEETMIGNVVKPVMPPKPARTENTELWELLNYSKIRLETGATPQVRKRGGCRSSSLSGDDAMFFSFKCEEVGDTSAPPQDGDDTSDASVDGSVSLEYATKYYGEGSRKNSDNDDVDGLTDFKKDKDDEDLDPEEARALHEAANQSRIHSRIKAASVRSVTEATLTDVQMLQAIAIAEDAAKKGEEKFSTKISLFKLNEAKIDDLLEFLDYSCSPTIGEIETTKRHTAGWQSVRGRHMKKLGKAVKDFKEKRCEKE